MRRAGATLAALVVAGIAAAGGFGVGSGGLQGAPQPEPVSGAAITPSSVTTTTVKTAFLDAGTGMVNGQLQVLGPLLVATPSDLTLGVSSDINMGNNANSAIRGGSVSVNVHDAIGFRVVYSNTVILNDAVNITHTNPDGTSVITGDTTSPAKAAFRITPQDAEPTGPNVVGDMYVTTAGVLKICTVAGSPGTWVSVGAQ